MLFFISFLENRFCSRAAFLRNGYSKWDGWARIRQIRGSQLSKQHLNHKWCPPKCLSKSLSAPEQFLDSFSFQMEQLCRFPTTNSVPFKFYIRQSDLTSTILLDCRIFGIKMCSEGRWKRSKVINLFENAAGIQQTDQSLQQCGRNTTNWSFRLFLSNFWRNWLVCCIPVALLNRLISLFHFRRLSWQILIPKMRQLIRICFGKVAQLSVRNFSSNDSISNQKTSLSLSFPVAMWQSKRTSTMATHSLPNRWYGSTMFKAHNQS